MLRLYSICIPRILQSIVVLPGMPKMEESFKKEEAELQAQLRSLCNGSGQELYPDQSAKIFDKLGLLYQAKSLDKISLIQSAALFNAAIVRQRFHQEFRDHLQDLCKKVLNFAGARLKDADLVSLAKGIKEDQLSKLRSNVIRNLKNVKKIPNGPEDSSEISDYVGQVRILQNGLSEDYKRIMADVSNKCIEIMGRGGVEDTRLEAKAKDTKKIRGQGQGQPFRGQTLSRPRTGMLEAKAKDQGHKAQVLSKKKKKKKVFTKIFQAISTKKRFPKNFSTAPQNFNFPKNSAVLDPRTGQFSRT